MTKNFAVRIAAPEDLDQHPLDIADRGLDEGGLAKLHLVRRHACRHRLLDGGELPFDRTVQVSVTSQPGAGCSGATGPE